MTFGRLIIFGISCLFAVHPAQFAHANERLKYASIIIDADSQEILHARNIDAARYPASTTKMMTLYLVFDALDRGQIHLNDKMKVSRFASRTAPVKLGLRPGTTITVDNAIKALAVLSANDVSVVFAEHLSGSQAKFADLMNAKAHALGMRSSRFTTPHGLPDPDQITTARDMAKLGEALYRNHQKYYYYFSTPSFKYQGRTYNNHNTLLGRVPGVDGFKTGFTNASGYNLVVSAKRDGHRIIAVVLGGASSRSRDKHMADLVERGFDVIRQNSKLRTTAVLVTSDEQSRTLVKTPPRADTVNAFTLRAAYQAPNRTVRIVQGGEGLSVPTAKPTQGWVVQIGAFRTPQAAKLANTNLAGIPELNLAPNQAFINPVPKGTQTLYRARFGNLSFEHANRVCKILANQARPCHVIAP